MFSKVSCSCRKNSTGKGFLYHARGTAEGKAAWKVWSCQDKKGVFSTGDVLQKAFLRIWFSCDAELKLHNLRKKTRSCHKTQIIPWPALPTSFQTGTGSKFRLGRRQKSQEFSCSLGFHRMGVGRSWVNSYKPQLTSQLGPRNHFHVGKMELKQELQTFSVLIY